ncbi:MAG: redoxin domain-containing protein [Streptosporangiales bacterium]|nr:redoxin domain-containing protein [Streptosporangiales bacterium]
MPAAVCGALAALLLAGCAGQAAGSGPDGADNRYVAGDGSSRSIPAAERAPAPAVAGTTLDGERTSLADRKGKVVVINFWASWCAPCRAEAPALEEVAKETKDDGVVFLGINIKDNKAPAQAFVRNFKTSYPSLYDQSGAVAMGFRRTVPPSAIPSTLVIDRQGRVAAVVIGQTNYRGLKRLVDPVAAERP